MTTAGAVLGARSSSRPNSRLIGWVFAVYCLLALAGYGRLFALPLARMLAGQPPQLGSDFLALSIGGRLVAAGQGGRLYDLQAQTAAQAALAAQTGGPAPAWSGSDETLALFTYPPFVAGLFSLLDRFPLGAAYLIWAGAGLLATGLALAALVRAGPRLPRRTMALASLAAVSFLPVWLVLLRGQASLLILALWAAAYVALKNGHDELAGAGLALALFKPQLAVVPLVVLAYQRRWRALAGWAVVAAGLTALSLAVAGPAGLAHYAGLLLQIGRDTAGDSLVHPTVMLNWRGTVLRLLTALGLDASPAGAALALVGWGLAALASLAALLQAWRRPWSDALGQLDLLWPLTLLVSMLVSPHLHEYEMALWLLAGILLLLAGHRRASNLTLWQELLMAGHALPTALIVLPLSLAWRAQAGMLLGLLMAIVLWQKARPVQPLPNGDSRP